MASNRTVLEITIAVWIVLILVYLTNTPIDHRTHNFLGHWEYSYIIAKEHRLPLPYEGEQTYNPPFYYLINSIIAPKSLTSYGTDKVVHVHYVRFLSAIYGAITLLIFFLFLQKIEISPLSRLLVLLFTATTPKFVFIFSSYNPDSLTAMLSILILYLSYELGTRWSWRNGLFLLLASVVGLYVSHNVIFCFVAVLIFCLKDILKFKLPAKEHIRILSILALSFSLFFSWTYFHNYFYTGKFIPQSYSLNETNERPNFIEVLKISKHEWDEPWAYTSSGKNKNYFSFAFVTSIIGEYKFIKPHISFVQLILCIHLIIYLLALYEILTSTLTKQAGVLIVLSHLIHLASIACHKIQLGYLMDFRYISFSWIGWVILYASTLLKGNRWRFWGIKPLIIIGIILHIYLLATVKGGYAY